MTDARATTPARLALDLKTQRLSVAWHDGHESVYDANYLRFVCPCAGCRGHAPGQVPPPTWEQCREVRVEGAAQVGGYALQFRFSDGHDTGLYAYDLLRSRCSCSECSMRRGGAEGG